MLTFFVPGDVPTASHHAKKIVRKGAKAGMADTDELVAAKAYYDERILPFRPLTPVPGPIGLTLSFQFDWTTKASKRVRALGRAWKTTKPDCSNMAKTLEDRLVEARFFGNDAEVAVLVVRKCYSDIPGFGVSIETLPPLEEENV